MTEAAARQHETWLLTVGHRHAGRNEDCWSPSFVAAVTSFVPRLSDITKMAMRRRGPR